MKKALLLSLALTALACAERPDPRFQLKLPSRLSQGLASTDAALCEGLDVSLTFDRTDDLASPPLDGVALIPKSDVPCTWVLEHEAQLLAGTYDLVVRFATDDTPPECAGPLVVGAYVRRGLSFPFPASFSGLTDDDFVSRPGEESRLGDPSVNFDPDGDGRDSLAELAQGSGPCKQSSVPVPTLSVSTTTTTETSTVMITIASLDADDVAHRLALRIQHPSGPNVGTEFIAFEAYTDARGVVRSTVRGPAEHWSLRAEVDTDAKDGAASIQLHFVPDEPFIGALTVALDVDDGQGNVLAHAAPVTLTVSNVDDPTRLLFQDPGVELSVLRFAEQASPADSYRFRFDDPDLGSDVGTWTPSINSGPSGLGLRRDGGFWVIEWSPSNGDAVLSPRSVLDLGFRDGSGALRGHAAIALEISPLLNDPPVLVPPAVGDLALPATPFTEHRVPFFIDDPDESEQAPSCALTIQPAPGTSCAAPFSSARCEPTGLRNGPHWPFALILVPAADYGTACGTAPGFLASLSITDVPPTGARNGPAHIDTGTNPLALATANVVSAAIVSGGPGAVPGATDPSPPLVHGSLGKALVQVFDSGGTEVVTVVDLNGSTPSFSHRFAQAEFCNFDENKRPREIAAADEVNGRMLVISRGYSAGSCGPNGANLVSLSGPSTVFHTSVELCGEPFNDREGNPVVDAAGNFYVACNTSPGRIARIAPNGTIATKNISAFQSSGGELNVRTALITDAAGTPWLAWPDAGGILLVNLSTFDQAAPSTERISMPARWRTDTLDDVIVDPWRHSFLIAYNRQSTTAQLLRVRFEAGARTLDAPLDLGAIGGNTSNGTSYMRLVLRDAGPGSVDPGADLVISPGSSGDPRPHIDLDTWAVTTVRPPEDYYLGGGSAGIFPSPDKRYYVAPTTSNHEDGSRGMYLYRFDPGVQRTFITLPVPNGGADWAARTEVSESGNLMVITERDGNGGISVIHFVDAAAGRD
ncbi:MAG: hypothetical protein U1E65_27735 [Myxococcota bacterium]